MSSTNAPMTVLITGGAGFVMSNLAAKILEADPDAAVVILDLAPPDGVRDAFLAPFRDRVTTLQGDIRDRGTL